ncbi:MAG TPA: thioredoxin-disulfide reductase [Cyanobacteria bacterium UBA8530]|nr:thioredoxin-disulfide reductase [Cyanobacteria bacterium UBA8530]
MMREISEKEYQELVLDAKGPVVVDFFSTECPPCEALAPKFEFFAELYRDEVSFFKVFRQGNKELALKLGVKSSPTLLFYLDGAEVAPRLSGAVKKSEILRTMLGSFALEDRTLGTERKTVERDLVIIGAGPAGLTAGIYAGRAKIDTLLIDQGNPGGQVNLTHLVANYPGEEAINGYMLMHKMTEQAKKNQAEILAAAEIVNLDLEKKIIDVDDCLRIQAKAIVLATGARPRELGLPGEKEFFGKGISYCATCDGKFYEGKDIIVIGGGNSAVEETIFLAQFVSKITVIHQFDAFQANQTAIDELQSNPRVEVLFSHEPRAFLGEGQFERLEVEDLKTKERKILSGAAGVFLFVGYVPQTELFEQLKLSEGGYVEANEDMATDIPGVFAAGDVRRKNYRQITTAVSDGTIAALSAQKYLRQAR